MQEASYQFQLWTQDTGYSMPIRFQLVIFLPQRASISLAQVLPLQFYGSTVLCKVPFQLFRYLGEYAKLPDARLWFFFQP